MVLPVRTCRRPAFERRFRFTSLRLVLPPDVMLSSPTCPVAAAGRSRGGSLPRSFLRAVSHDSGHVPAPELQALLSVRAERRPRFAREWAQVTPHWVSAFERHCFLRFSRHFAYDPRECAVLLTYVAHHYCCRCVSCWCVILNLRPVLLYAVRSLSCE